MCSWGYVACNVFITANMNPESKGSHGFDSPVMLQVNVKRRNAIKQTYESNDQISTCD